MKETRLYIGSGIMIALAVATYPSHISGPFAAGSVVLWFIGWASE